MNEADREILRRAAQALAPRLLDAASRLRQWHLRRRRRRRQGIAAGAGALVALVLALVTGGAVWYVLMLGFLALGVPLLSAAEPAPSLPAIRVHLVGMVCECVRCGEGEVALFDLTGVVPSQEIAWGDLSSARASIERLGESTTALAATAPVFLRRHNVKWHDWRTAEWCDYLGARYPLLDTEAATAELVERLAAILKGVERRSVQVSPLPSGYGIAGAVERLAAGRGPQSILCRPPDAPPSTGRDGLLEAILLAGDDDADISAAAQEVGARLAEMARHRSRACELLAEYTRSVTLPLGDGSIAHLCPKCNEAFLGWLGQTAFGHAEPHAIPDLLTTARMQWEEEADEWVCTLCAVRCREPFRVPRLLTECLVPAFTVLLEEHHEARQAIYADIANQKRHYRNEAEKELYQRRDAHRRDSGPLLARLHQLEGEADATRAKLTAFSGLLARWRLVEERRLKELEESTARVVSEIREAHAGCEERFRRRSDEILGAALSQMEGHARLARRETAAQFGLMQQIADNTRRAAVAGETSAACAMVYIHAQGLDRPRDPLGRLRYGLDNLGRRLSFNSPLENELQRLRGA